MGSNGKHAAERHIIIFFSFFSHSTIAAYLFLTRTALLVIGTHWLQLTGANKGIGLETVRQLASQGVTVVLTARNEKRGMEALLKLQELGLSNIVFH